MVITKKKYPYWALFYHHEGFEMDGDKLMGRQAAGNAYLRALVQSKPENLAIYLKNKEQKELAKKTISSFLESDQEININAIHFISPQKSQDYGGIFLPGPSLSEYALARSKFSHNSYSLVGITHTTASHGAMTSFSSLLTSPVMPWDAIICTSDVVADTIRGVVDEHFNQLQFYLGAKHYVLPKLPVIPLGVHPEDFNYSNEFITSSRKKLDISENDIVIVYVGRLSFHAKAHHLPMYFALQSAAKNLKKGKIHLIQTGWFANNFIETSFKEEAKLICPDIICHFLDGKDQQNKHTSLASGDIFMSLSDNFQETFGLTPLEGMAAGIPVIVSDWNGYKSTVRDNIDGFRIPSYSLMSKSGEQLAYDHMIGKINYDQYIGHLSQRVAIDVDQCVAKLNLLIENKDLRRKLGNNAKKSANKEFSWGNVLKKYRDLSNELDALRINSSEEKNIPKFNLPADRLDPLAVFKTYPTFHIENNSLVKKTTLSHEFSIQDIMNLSSVKFALVSLPPLESFLKVMSFFEDNKFYTIEKIIKSTDLSGDIVKQIITWLLKYSFVSLKRKNDE